MGHLVCKEDQLHTTGPVYCDGAGCHVLCLRHGILQCDCTLAIIPLLQAGNVVI